MEVRQLAGALHHGNLSGQEPFVRASGPSGALRVGYQWAADLGAWELAPAPDRPAYALRATITKSHDYWIDQEPLDLALTLGHTEWLWRGVEVHRGAEGSVSVVLTERPIVSERGIIDAARSSTQKKRGWF